MMMHHVTRRLHAVQASGRWIAVAVSTQRNPASESSEDGTSAGSHGITSRLAALQQVTGSSDSGKISFVSGWHLPHAYVTRSSMAVRCHMTSSGTHCVSASSDGHNSLFRSFTVPHGSLTLEPRHSERSTTASHASTSSSSSDAELREDEAFSTDEEDYASSDGEQSAAAISYKQRSSAMPMLSLVTAMPRATAQQSTSNTATQLRRSGSHTAMLLRPRNCMHRLLARRQHPAHSKVAALVLAATLSFLWTMLLLAIGCYCAAAVVRLLRAAARMCMRRQSRRADVPDTPDLKGRVVSRGGGVAAGQCKERHCNEPLLMESDSDRSGASTPTVSSAYLKQ